MHDNLIMVYLDGTASNSSVVREWTRKGFVTINLECGESWSEMYASALHELTEYSMMLMRCAYQPNNSLLETGDSSTRRFLMTHADFAQSIRHVADVMIYLSPKLATEWKKMRRNK